MLITYCEFCGIRIDEPKDEITALCSQCTQNGKPARQEARDSGRLVVATLPSDEEVLEEIQKMLNAREEKAAARARRAHDGGNARKIGGELLQ